MNYHYAKFHALIKKWNFKLYRYTSLISAASWYTGGEINVYKINLFLVDYIVKK